VRVELLQASQQPRGKEAHPPMGERNLPAGSVP